MAENRESSKLTNDERNQVAQWLLQRSSNDKLQYGASMEAATLFKVSRRTIWCIWKSVAAQQALGQPIQLKSMKKGSTHNDRYVIDASKVKSLSVLQRSSIRVMACNLGVSKSLVGVWVKDKKLRAHTNAIKPFLTPQNKISRLRWSLRQLGSINKEGFIKFQTMFNTIHIDEKWFYLTKSKDRYYLMPGEADPYRACKSKRYIPKIMFTSAIARPIIDSQGKVIFDGKMEIFPFTYEEAAQRNSKNRPAGTMEVKAIPNITQNVIRDSMINKVCNFSLCYQNLVTNSSLSHFIFNSQMIPYFKSKWPSFASKNIFIQQDNAKPHIKVDDLEFLAVPRADGFNIQLLCQPANSPDTNVNDLGFFRAIQSLKDQKPANEVGELIKNVQETYNDYPPQKINHVFLTLQCCYQEIMKAKGDNNYKIPYMNKERLERIGMLPDAISISQQLFNESMEFLEGNNHADTTNVTDGFEEDYQQNMTDILEGLTHVNIN
ncbi:uncharacterized protein LOC131014673 [Salvia miltiorrhiza]|uniref:uncharacterized protein LOC131014673 n=1 Tax=Salvia miltiorrhiza TaxID=226208 RepID=UPI0025AC00A8|nr:uncharacterized protein LOC131014673 [Salvia miltiorrhiza]